VALDGVHPAITRGRRPGHAPRFLSAEYLAGLTGGIFLSHVLFINLVRTWLGDAGITPHLGWAGTVALTFLLTIGSAAVFTACILRTPLRWVLTGPVRAEQRCRLGPEVPATDRSFDTDEVVVEPARTPVRV
jgi:hypothetical protein